MRTDRGTDMTKLIVALRNFENAPTDTSKTNQFNKRHSTLLHVLIPKESPSSNSTGSL
jgi:hypothetical protein